MMYEVGVLKDKTAFPKGNTVKEEGPRRTTVMLNEP